LKICAPFFSLCAVAALLCAAAQRPLTLHKFREPGDRLDISIQQELDRAADIGTLWLEMRLRDDDARSLHTNLAATALTLLALHPNSGGEPATGATARALCRLQQHCAANAAPDIRTAAWGYAALTLHAADSAVRTRLENRLRHALAAPETDRDERDLCREMLLSLAAAPVAAPQRNAPEGTAIDAQIPLLRLWLNARHINRESGGQLISAAGERLDWRRLYARRIISSQRLSPQGGGFWRGAGETADIGNTALALLIIKEL
jgi:hypothetical protein